MAKKWKGWRIAFQDFQVNKFEPIVKMPKRDAIPRIARLRKSTRENPFIGKKGKRSVYYMRKSTGGLYSIFQRKR